MGVIEYLEFEELGQLLHNIASERDRLLARLLYESGCSIAEISELKTSAVHADGTIHFAGRVATISPDLAAELLRQASTHIFHTRQTPSISPKRIQQILKPYLSRVHNGKNTPHLLRYTHIVHAYKQGISLGAICKQTGLTAVRVAQIVESINSSKNYNNFFKQKGVRA